MTYQVVYSLWIDFSDTTAPLLNLFFKSGQITPIEYKGIILEPFITKMLQRVNNSQSILTNFKTRVLHLENSTLNLIPF